MKKYRFALMSFVFVALAAYALSPATQWGDVSPTNTLAEVAAGAGLATSNAVNAKLDKTDGTARGLTITPRLEIEDDDSWCTIRRSTHGWYLETDESADRIYLPTGDGKFALVSDIPSVRTIAYNLYPVDLGGGTREVPSDTQTYMAIGYDVSVTGMASTVVGNAARARGENSSAFGYGAEALADNSLVVGAHSTAGGTQSLAIGVQAAAGAYGFAIGNAAEAPADGTALGFQAKGTGPGTAIGAHAEATGWESAAIGHNAVASGASSIQLGTGTNNSNNSVKVYGRMLLDADGHVPLLSGKTYDLSTSAGITNALADVIRALGGAVQ